MKFHPEHMGAPEPSEATHQTLEDQFAHPERIRIGEEEVDVYDIVPEASISEVPTVLAPGFSATPTAHEQNILGLAHEGRRVISVNAPHGLAKHAIERRAMEHAGVELAKLSAIVQALDERGIAKADVVAHSEGAIYMALAALLYPGRFRNMVLVNPGGMIGKDNVIRLASGMFKELHGQMKSEAKRNDADRQKPGDPLAAIKILASNLRRSWESVKAITRSDTVKILKQLKRQGIGISIIHGVDDQVFPMERVQKEVGADAITGFYSVRGGHNEIFIRPKQYTRAVALVLGALEARGKAHEREGKS